MKEKRPKKKVNWRQCLGMGFGSLMGGLLGFSAMVYIEERFAPEGLGQTLMALGGMLVGVCVGVCVQIVIHEAGHLVFGLLSGYRFGSFRIFSFMWIKEDGKLRLKRLSIAGTGGQCLMTPPDMVDGRIPLVLYNLGGSLMNVLAGLAALGMSVALEDIPLVSAFLMLLAVSGFILAAMNGIPMRAGTVDNDGYNAFALTRNAAAMRSFWVQMKANEQIARGVRLKDMPEEWFAVPGDEEMQNSMVVTMGVFACNRLMDAQRFEEADALMEHLLSLDSGIIGLHRSLLICDRMYVELIGPNRAEVLSEMRSKEQLKFMQQMKNFPSVLRTEYVYALLGERDADKARELKDRFERSAKSYPYESDIQSERELIDIAESRL